jgi:hypothetical protein
MSDGWGLGSGAVILGIVLIIIAWISSSGSFGDLKSISSQSIQIIGLFGVASLITGAIIIFLEIIQIKRKFNGD